MIDLGAIKIKDEYGEFTQKLIIKEFTKSDGVKVYYVVDCEMIIKQYDIETFVLYDFNKEVHTADNLFELFGLVITYQFQQNEDINYLTL